MTLLKKLRKRLVDAMAKNRRKSGKSARNGNAPSPYTKYQKQPYVYMFKRQKASQPVVGPWKVGQKARKKAYQQMAAE